jgi:pimeloyl-ACP methyl ester carboxylesterase
MGGQVVNLPAVRHPHTVRSVIAPDPRTAQAERRPRASPPGSPRTVPTAPGRPPASWPRPSLLHAPAGLRTAHVRTMLGTPDHVIAQAYAGMYADPGAVGVRSHREAYLRRRGQPALTVWTSAEAAAWEHGALHVPGSRVDHRPGTGHHLHEEQPERTVHLIEAWAARAGSRMPRR